MHALSPTKMIKKLVQQYPGEGHEELGDRVDGDWLFTEMFY